MSLSGPRGPHVVDLVRFLSDVLCRMQGHHDKERATLRRLGISRLARRAAERGSEGR